MAPLSRIAAWVCACSASALLGCAVQVLETDDYAESFAPADARSIALFGVDGDVVVRGAELNDVSIRGTQTSIGATRRSAREGLRYAVLGAEYRADELLLSFEPPFELEGLVDLELNQVSTLPREMGLFASLESGNIDVIGLEGELDLETADGDIAIDDPGASFVRAEVGTGVLRYAVGLTGFHIECVAEGGGTVEVDAALLDAGVSQETESDGTIVITYGEDTSKHVELRTSGGHIEVSLSVGAP
jgi:hypothetical protein